MKLIIDSDLGVDDGAALILALTYKKIAVQILGITTVAGNISSIPQIVANVSRILRLVGRTDIPIYAGSTGPLLKPLIQLEPASAHPEPSYYGVDGFGDCPQIDPPLVQSDFEAAVKDTSDVNFILNAANQYPGEITLVCLGPLSNIALALKMDAALPSKIKEIIVMGGNIHGTGNMPFSTAEHNFYKDPEAAYIVLREMPMTKIIPWEMFKKHSASEAFINSYYSDRTKITSFMKSISYKAFEADLKTGSLQIGFCDDLAMAVCLDPSVVLKTDRCAATVELQGRVTRGQLAIDWTNQDKVEPNVEIVTDYDVKVVESMLLKSVGL